MNLRLILLLALLPLFVHAEDTTNAAPKPAKPKPPVREPVVVTEAAPLPIEIPATAPNIRYIGRWNLAKDPRAQWSAATLAIKFNGTDLNAKIEDGGHDVWQIEVDGKPTAKLPLGKGTFLYSLAAGLPPGEHLVHLVKGTESFLGVTTFHGYQLGAGGAVVPIEPATRRLEVVGDSLTTGMGNEGTPQENKDLADWQNAYTTYGPITARRFGADYTCVAWSGYKMWPDRMMPELYDDLLAGDKSVKWDPSKFPADAVLINLSSNDFGGHGPYQDGAAWSNAYKAFVARLRTNYPNAIIYCASSPFINGEGLTLSKGYLQKIVADLNAAGDTKVKFLEFDHMSYTDGIGGAGHPNVKTNQIMADKWSAALQADLGWTPVP